MTPGAKRNIVEFIDVDTWFGEFQALKNINLAIKQGERIVVCGPSGSGKSTLIRCVNGLQAHQQGQVIVDGYKLNSGSRNLAKVRQEVGMVFQQFNIFPHMTVLDNLILAPMWVKHLSRREATEVAMHYLERVRIGEHAGKFPNQLSGGQQQRVAIARALCLKPRVMLFDEPTSSLDPEMVKEVLDVMVGLAEDGMTMMCVTHEMHFARTVADRIVFMDKGEILEIAPPEAFFTQAQDPRAQLFLQSIGSA
jgi:general L-amino acid transport system ATP-binding protein